MHGAQYGYDISADSAESYIQYCHLIVNTHRRTAQRWQTRPTSTKHVIRVSSLDYITHSPEKTRENLGHDLGFCVISLRVFCSCTRSEVLVRQIRAAHTENPYIDSSID